MHHTDRDNITVKTEMHHTDRDNITVKKIRLDWIKNIRKDYEVKAIKRQIIQKI